ncbi:MAG TPA: hypothetical protein PLP17_12075, partial [Oligoflexia bacterium]|nr:hypothetical protein [Oligoflexia bacterium]
AEVDVKKQPVREATVDVVEPEPKKEVVGAAEGERKQAAASAAPEKTPQPAQTPHAVPGITPTAVPVVAPAVPERAAESAAVAAAAQKDVPTIQTQAPVLPSPTPELQPSATAVPSLPVQAVMTLRRGDRVLAVEDSFSADSLAAIRWSAAVTGLAVGEGKGERDGVLREFSLNFFSVRDARLLGRIAPEAISPQPEAKSLMVEGSLSGAGRYDPGVGDYRLDLVYRGEVLTSRSFSLYKARVTAGAAVDAASSISPGGAVAVVRGPAAGGPPEVEPAREPAATEQNLAHIRPVKPVLPSTGELAPPVSGVGQNETQESSTLLSSYETARKDMEPGYPDLGGLPPARGSSQGQAPLRRQAPPPQLPFGEGMERLPQLPAEQPPVLAGKMAGQQTQPAITGEENYRGKLNLVGDSGLEEPREMTMALVVRGDEVEGSARIAGLGEFSARGKVYPRGIELTLAGGGYALQLSGARYARSLRGRYSLPARNLRGVWSADRID